jgi:enamine deaminase RidA (YjgF/YER057c/UK114 family)
VACARPIGDRRAVNVELTNPDSLHTPRSYSHVATAAGSRLVFVAGHRPEYLAGISAARIAIFGDHRPADALIGVATLAEPGYLIEVDAIAVVD